MHMQGHRPCSRLIEIQKSLPDPVLALPAPVTLEANKAYYRVTSVSDQGNTCYDWNQKVTATGGLTMVSTVWAPSGGIYSRYGGGGSSYGPVGLESGYGAQIRGSKIHSTQENGLLGSETMGPREGGISFSVSLHSLSPHLGREGMDPLAAKENPS